MPKTPLLVLGLFAFSACLKPADQAGGDPGEGGSGGGTGGRAAGGGGSGGSLAARLDAGATGGAMAGTGGTGGTGPVDAGSDPARADAAGFEVPGVDAPVIVRPEPPATWKEHWFEHVDLLRLVDKDDNVAVYFDDQVNPALRTWLTPLLSRLWGYTKQTYGVPGEQRLFIVAHTDHYSGGHHASMFDAAHDYRNIVDLGLAAASWSDQDYVMEFYVGLAGRIIDDASNGVENAPSRTLTEARFREIYAYDAFRSLGLAAAANRVYTSSMSAVSTYPRANTYWFRDWFHPLWRAGTAAVFARYYKLLQQHYSKIPRPGGDGFTYVPQMNWGEYIHFMSGAAGKDLKPLATTAFGWYDEWERAFQRAKTDFPAIRY